MHAGGEKFHYIAALNDQSAHIGALCSLIQRHAQGWPEVSGDAENADQLAASEKRALAMRASR